jgi:anaerobic magnesium-protoporphyrin IX monomethyl ester cyclase
MKVALIFPTWTDAYGGYAIFARRAANWPPLNLCIVAALAEKEGHEVIIIDAEAERKSVDDVISELKDFGADVIGFTANTPFYHVAAEWSVSIKKAIPSAVIAIGGQHITVLKEEAMLDGFDVGFIGEAEDAFPSFLREYEKNKTIPEWGRAINGLIYRQEDGSLVNTGQANPVYDVNEMPIPSRHLLNMSLYTLGTEKRGQRRMTSIQTVRGCPFKCTFCSTKVFGRNFRRRDPKLVIEEIIECVNEYGSEHFMFLDDTLTMHKKHFLGMCDEIIDAKERGDLPESTSFEGSTRANVVDEEIAKRMAEAGFVRLSFGLESVDTVVRKLMKKQVKMQTYTKAYEFTDKYGIETVTSAMIGQPGDNHESVKKTLSFLRWAKLIKRANLSIAVPYPGTELYEWAKEEKYGMKLLEPDFKKWRRYNVATMKVGDLMPEDWVEYQNDAYASIYLAPWRWKALYQKDGLGGVWLTFKRLLHCIKKGRFEMLFVSPEYWKTELDRDPHEVKETVKRLTELNSKKATPIQNASTSVVKEQIAPWKIHNTDMPEGAPGTMFTSAEKDIGEAILSKGSDAHKVVVQHDGITTSFKTVPGLTVLEAAREANVDLPFSCAMGGCGSCKVQLVSGEVLLASPHCLDSAELDDGEILACRSVALTDIKFNIRDVIAG